MNYGNSAKKKTIYLISGLLIIALIGTITYFAWSNNKPTENEEPINSKKEVQQLQTELSSLKSKLNNISDNNKKSQLANKLIEIENKVNKVANLDKPAIKKLEQEIKEVKRELGLSDKSDNPPQKKDDKPSDKKEGKFIFYGDSLEKSGYSKFGGEGENFFLFYISKNHPRIKELLQEGKLLKDKHFTIRYGKADNISEKGTIYTFNENNQELEIIEVKNPSPDPSQNKIISYVITKINDNTFKYHFSIGDESGEKLVWRTVINFLKENKYKKFGINIQFYTN